MALWATTQLHQAPHEESLLRPCWGMCLQAEGITEQPVWSASGIELCVVWLNVPHADSCCISRTEKELCEWEASFYVHAALLRSFTCWSLSLTQLQKAYFLFKPTPSVNACSMQCTTGIKVTSLNCTHPAGFQCRVVFLHNSGGTYFSYTGL